MGFGIAAAINYIIDPYGLNSNKNKFDTHLSYVNKPNITKLKINLGSDYYLIGTSRAMRVNPNLIEKYLPNKQVYSINISGATFKENSMLANKVIGNGNQIIYGFDAFSLNKNRFAEEEITNRYNTFKEVIKNETILSEFLSIEFLIVSIEDVIKRILGFDINQTTLNENIEDYDDISFEGIEKHLDLSNQGVKKVYTNFETVPKTDIIQLAKTATKDDIFIIYPKYFYHYILFQKYQDIEVKYFNAIETLVQNTEAKVWSFYQINNITTNNKNFDKNGWHFKPKIADLIFAKIFNDDSATLHPKFGILLTKDNVEGELKKIHQEILHEGVISRKKH
jgi:hypothetical protein